MDRVANPERIGKYDVLDVLGQGGMGVVYRARDPVISRQVAIKVILDRALAAPTVRDRFYREARSAGALSHENVMTIYDVGEDDGRPYIVMELLDGTDLRHLLGRRPLPSLDSRLDIAIQVCQGLGYAHSRGVVHRDIKPENVQVTASGRVKLLDFGIARIQTETHTLTQAQIGTPRYMSPEQIKGEPIDGRTDIFSFGVLLYELLSGANPFTGEHITSVIYKVLHEDPPPPQLPDTPAGRDLQRIVARCMAKSPHRRYAKFAEVADALRAVREANARADDGGTRAGLFSWFKRDATQTRANIAPDAYDATQAAPLRSVANDDLTVPLESAESEPEVTAERTATLAYLPTAASETPSSTGLSPHEQSEPEPESLAALPMVAPAREEEETVAGLHLDGGRDLTEESGEEPLAVAALPPSLKGPAARIPSLGSAAMPARPVPPAARPREPLASVRMDRSRVGAKWIAAVVASCVLIVAVGLGYRARTADADDEPGTAELTATTLPSPDDGPDAAPVPETQPLTLDEAAPVPESGPTVPRPGVLEVRSDPPGARVYVDGTQQGVTPLSLSLATGRYDIRLTRDGFGDVRRRADVLAGRSARISARLVPAQAAPSEGTVRVTVRPWGDVYVDGARRLSQVSHAQTLSLPPGRYTLAAVHPTLGRSEQRVTVASGQQSTFDIDLRPADVTVTAFDSTGAPLRGEIFLDGASTGRWTPSVIPVPLGQHQFEVRSGSERRGPRTVTISGRSDSVRL